MRLEDNSVGYYDRDAAAFIRRYDALRFEDVQSGVLRFLPTPPASILDIGAGSGRDARALAELGYDVTAVEPAAGFRTGAAEKAPKVRWIDDRFPNLSSLNDERRSYDFILCSAVLMLVQPEDIQVSFDAMARLLAPGGKIAISVRDPVSNEPAEIFHRHETNRLMSAAAAAGLHIIDTQEPSDALGRPTHRWRSIILSSENL